MPIEEVKKPVSFPRSKFYLDEDFMSEIVVHSLTEMLKSYLVDIQEMDSAEFRSVYEGIKFQNVVDMITFFNCGFVNEELKKVIREFNRLGID